VHRIRDFGLCAVALGEGGRHWAWCVFLGESDGNWGDNYLLTNHSKYSRNVGDCENRGNTCRCRMLNLVGAHAESSPLPSLCLHAAVREHSQG